jgi:hypothetical protein
MRMPEDIRAQIRDHLWAVADKVGWSELSDAERTRYYEMWTRDSTIGGKLGHFMDPRKVRVYIKDSLLKPYERDRLSDIEQAAMKCSSVSSNEAFAEAYIKPHGRRLADGRVVCWGKSRDWKLILMAVFERAFLAPKGRPYAVVLIETGKTADESTKAPIREAARRLGVERVEWIE